MPSIELKYLNEMDDGRRKLPTAKHTEIRELYKQPQWSQRALARKYGVSRRLIQFILDKEKAGRVKEQFKERRKDGRYYDREKHTLAMRKFRAKKRQAGLIKSQQLLKEK